MTSQKTAAKETSTDPACVISTDCARAFTLLHRLNLRYGLCCFGFHGYTVVYPVPIQYRINLLLRGNS